MSGSFTNKRWSVPERKREKLERKTALQPNHAQERTGERKAKKKNRGEGEGERARARERGGFLMESDYLFGAIVASLLAVIFLLRSRAKKTRTAGEATGAPKASALEAEAVGDGSSGEGADIIVVGAGVAGSALAYTLAKVRYLFLFCSKS